MPELVPPPGGYPETTALDTEAVDPEAIIDKDAVSSDNLQTGAGAKRSGEVNTEGKPSKKAKAERKGKKGDVAK